MSFTVRLAPFALLVFPDVEKENFGANFSVAQFATWNGTDRLLAVPSSLVMVPVMFWGLQFVGLIANPGRSIVALMCLISSGIPSRICGIEYAAPVGFVVTVTCAV